MHAREEEEKGDHVWMIQGGASWGKAAEPLAMLAKALGRGMPGRDWGMLG